MDEKIFIEINTNAKIKNGNLYLKTEKLRLKNKCKRWNQETTKINMRQEKVLDYGNQNIGFDSETKKSQIYDSVIYQILQQNDKIKSENAVQTDEINNWIEWSDS